MLKKEEWIVFAIFLLFAFLFIQFNNAGLVNITGMAVENASASYYFNVVLEKTQFSIGEPLKGYLNITFTAPFSPSISIQTSLDSISKQLVLKDYFTAKNISFTESPSTFSAYNPTDSKTFVFESPGSKNFAFMLPEGATVKDFNMKVIGSYEAPLSFVNFDVEDDTGKKEWKYFGNFITFNTNYVFPPSVKTDSEGSPIVLGGQENSNKTYFCEAIDLPESKDFQIGAKLKKINDGADVKAILLSFDGEYAYGGAHFCDIPEPTITSGWQTCNLSFDTSKRGVYLVCVYYIGDNEKEYYSLSRGTAVTDSRFDCPIGEGSSVCYPYTSKDYFIGIKTANYTGSLASMVSWDEGDTDQSMNFSLTEYLADCEEDEVGDCIVPVTVSSESAGTLQLGNLKIDYLEPGGASSYTDKFYDSSQIIGGITNLGDVDLTNVSKTIQISLSEFNITAPNITGDSKTLYLDVRMLPEGRISQPITVIGEGYVPETGTVEDKVSNAKKVISDMVSEHGEELSLFEIALDTKQLETFESEITKIKSDKNATIEETNSKLDKLAGQVDTYLSDKPKSFSVDVSFKDLYIPEPNDVEKVVLEEGDVQNVYFYQSNIEVTVEMSSYVLKKYNGETGKYSVIKKTITPRKSLANVYVYEVIPKTVANSVASIAFGNKDYEVVQQDPVIRYTFTTMSQPVTILYGIKDVTITQNMLLGLGSILVPKTIEEVSEDTSVCGNGVCEIPYEDKNICPEDCGGRRIPWWLIIILSVFLIAGIVYINFYRGKGSFRKVIGKSPFANPKDLESVKEYIKTAQGKGIKNPEIAKALLKSNWTKDQIVYAFEDLKWDGKRLFTIKLTPASKEKTKELEEFIKKCLVLNIAKEKITNALLQKGWAANRVNEAFAKVGEPKEKVETPKEKEKKIAYYFEGALEEEAKK